MAEASDESVAELRSENERLRAQLTELRDAAEAEPDPLAAGSRRQRWRGAVAVVLVVVAAILAPVSVVAVFADRQVNDPETFVSTFGPLIRDSDVQDLIVGTTVTQIDDAVDIDGLTASAVDGLSGLGLPPRASDALGLLQGPAAEGIRSLLRDSVRAIVTSDALSNVWDEALRTTSQQLRATLSNDQDAAVSIGSDGAVGVQIGPIVRQVKQLLVDRGFTFAKAIPEIQATVPVAEASQLAQAQVAYDLLGAAAVLLPWLTLALFVAAVLVAKRRARTAIVSAVILAVTMGVLAIGLVVGRIVFRSAVAEFVPARAADAIYNAIVANIANTTAAIGVLSVAVAVVFYAAGPFASSRALRRWGAHGAASIRSTAERYGVTTGAAGRWIHRYRILLRAAVAVVGAAVILFARPMSVSLVLWTAVLAILAVGVLELVARPPVDAEAESPPVVAEADRVSAG